MNKQFITPDLPYAYNALEPYIDEATMRVHHDKHHEAYTTNLNKALEKYPEWYEKSVEEILKSLDQVPEDVRLLVKNHAGGHLHHNILWETLTPAKGQMPEGELLQAINESFESFDNFKEGFTKMALSVFGSGWAWLSLDKGKLIIDKTANQDSPYSTGYTPLFGFDVWEHAYYLKYQNRRAEYLENIWPIINWDKISEQYKKFK
jgi:Fe-Mn family superoxide dismutase